jgi:CDP-6-deoxy-D-xylo-4-hexulose-3-dehydrase
MKNLARIRALVEEDMSGLPILEHDVRDGIPLQVPTFGADEVMAAVEALVLTEVTMGRRVRAFEEAWAAWCGTRHAIMVNSGSSANLLAWAGLKAIDVLREGDEVLVPAVGWSTTLFPIVQNGLVAVMVDIEPDTLCIDPSAALSALTEKTRAICAVHLLGCPADVPTLSAMGLPVMEDACAAHGAEREGRRVGSLGRVGTFSFFFSHHVTTMEGGVLVTDDDDLADALRSLRAHGWIREMASRDRLAASHDDIDPRFLFVTAGYNVRPPEVCGAFGLRQLERLPAFIEQRRANHADWCARVQALGLPIRVFPELPGTLHSAFAFPMLLGDGLPHARRHLQAFLESRGIATRPVSGGNLSRQPAARGLRGLRIPAPLVVADQIHDRAFFIGNSHAFRPAHGELLARTLEEYFHALPPRS